MCDCPSVRDALQKITLIIFFNILIGPERISMQIETINNVNLCLFSTSLSFKFSKPFVIFSWNHYQNLSIFRNIIKYETNMKFYLMDHDDNNLSIEIHLYITIVLQKLTLIILLTYWSNQNEFQCKLKL